MLTTFWDAFLFMKMHEFRLKFHWSLFLRVQLTIFQNWFEPMMVSLLTHICITQPRWVNDVVCKLVGNLFSPQCDNLKKKYISFRQWSILRLSMLTWTRRSENDNTPQPLDQWMNSSFIGQQVGNCKSFTLTHYFADLSAMHRVRRSIPLCIQHHIQLTSLSFQVSQTSHCWVTAISIFYLENPRSRSWVWSKFEVTMWV